MNWHDKLIVDLFGGTPAGKVLGMQVLIDPRIPKDTIRFVDPMTGKSTDFLLP